MGKRRQVFNASGLETQEEIKLAKYIMIALSCIFQKLIQTFAFRIRKKFNNSFY